MNTSSNDLLEETINQGGQSFRLLSDPSRSGDAYVAMTDQTTVDLTEFR